MLLSAGGDGLPALVLFELRCQVHSREVVGKLARRYGWEAEGSDPNVADEPLVARHPQQRVRLTNILGRAVEMVGRRAKGERA